MARKLKKRNVQIRKKELKKMREIHSQKESVTANSPQSTPTQTPPKHQSSSIANSQPMHNHADPTTVVEPTDLLPNNPMKCSFSGEPSTKKPFVNKRRAFSVLHCGVSDPYRPPAPAPFTPAERGSGLPLLPSLNSEETAAPDSVKLRRKIERFEKMKVIPRDDLRAGDSEEAVTVEGAEKSESITFDCPCGKGYEVLFSNNKRYCKFF